MVCMPDCETGGARFDSGQSPSYCMPYKDRDKQREFQRNRVKQVRAEWLAIHGPCVSCGSSADLQVDHKEPDLKVSHRVWSWAPARRAVELAKCQVLCLACHKLKTSQERVVPVPHGTDGGYTAHECRCALCKAAHSVKRKNDRILYGC